jgi:hypothetical protein
MNKTPAANRAWLTPETSRPFLIMCMSSMPCRVDPGRWKGFKPHHRLNDPFDRSMILLNQIVQVLNLAYLDLLTGFLLEYFTEGENVQGEQD